MRIILSRKGFDSSAGGCPNPILPDGRLLPLPIPDDESIVKYQDLVFDDLNLGQLVKHLTKDKVKPNQGAHLDPDMFPAMLDRGSEGDSMWQANLGQSASAQGHLQKQGVREGDIFLYFAVFQPVEYVRRRWQFVKGTKPLHMMWGYMQIGEVLKWDAIRENEQHQWLAYHPHWQYQTDALNTLYLSRQDLDLNPFVKVQPSFIPGAGIFTHASPELTLSAGQNLTDWQVPSWMYPFSDDSADSEKVVRPPLSYHTKPWRWHLEGDNCYLKAAARGQEFVLHDAYADNALPWLYKLIQQHAA
ncbi:hypothetical protein HF888_03990 [Bermanella marisrubri]|uniref:Nucleotide modification associated domain-containing protein n=1 Tax=Bermanella marisrubri TaxID=207949 RepID=Q1MYU8_9GAMM|nr:hypothetical protein [Bermanella marisrubri]EAT11108.1 hypothetical protein RED65_04919 [Oceanobacter sp. RED65] [Bermanella marisrubri]QIZ83436.1 hypothetical protein HF888_03990 [Bermanella marisrubri]